MTTPGPRPGRGLGHLAVRFGAAVQPEPQPLPAGQDDITPLCLEPRLNDAARRNQGRHERARDQLAALADLLVA
jgi:hypothetical protein